MEKEDWEPIAEEGKKSFEKFLGICILQITPKFRVTEGL
jgi:hypothetical protein